MKIRKFIVIVLLAVISILTGLLIVRNAELADRQLYQAAVIWSSDQTPGYENQKQGIYEAVADYKIQLSMIVASDAEKQLKALQQELDNGVDAVLIQALEDDRIQEMIAEADIPVITFDSPLKGNIGETFNCEDEKALRQLMEEMEAGRTFVYVSDKKDFSDERKRAAFEKICGEMGVSGRISDMQTLTKEQPDEVNMICRGDEELLLAAEQKNKQHGWYIYGWGQDAEVFRNLRDGIIEKMIFINNYARGYRSIQNVYAAITGMPPAEEWTEYILFDKENIYDRRYVDLLAEE